MVEITTTENVVNEAKIRKREYSRLHTKMCRLRKKKCVVCGNQADLEMILSGDKLCAKHSIPRIKDLILKEKKE